MKICTVCKKLKRTSSFNFKSTTKDKRQPHCRTCSKKLMKKYYRLNRVNHMAAVAKRSRVVESLLRKKIWAYLQTHACVDCQERDPVVLEFDHVRGKKLKEVSRMVRNGFSWSAIEAEIKKCDVRCCNCHRRRTYKKLKSWRCVA